MGERERDKERERERAIDGIAIRVLNLGTVLQDPLLKTTNPKVLVALLSP